MIQIITGDNLTKNKFNADEKFSISDFKSPKAFDDFEWNILDLGFEDLWRYKGGSIGSINMFNDLKHYNNIVRNSNNTKILVILPQNIIYKYYFSSDRYHQQEYLKNMLEVIEKLIFDHIYSYAFQLSFETTITTLGELKIKADFHFNKECFQNEEIIMLSDNSKKLTSIKVKENLYYTTLDLMSSKNAIEKFMKNIKISEDEIDIEPEWVKDINILDDIIVKQNIDKIESKIEELEIKKNIENKKINENKRIKSILYQTDKSLQNIIIQILNEMLEYEDDEFVDKMEEDYKIKKDEITFIIETKGLSRNIKGEDISKTSNHVEIYLDELEEQGITENVKGIYIVATQRNKKVEDREKTPDRQIKIAKRDNILIIRTEQLLEMFEDFRNKKTSTEDIIKIFSEQIGELKYEKR